MIFLKCTFNYRALYAIIIRFLLTQHVYLGCVVFVTDHGKRTLIRIGDQPPGLWGAARSIDYICIRDSC